MILNQGRLYYVFYNFKLLFCSCNILNYYFIYGYYCLLCKLLFCPTHFKRLFDRVFGFFFVWIVDSISGGFFLVSLLLCASVLEHVLSRYLVRFLD
jgi:hypothetical protein